MDKKHHKQSKLTTQNISKQIKLTTQNISKQIKLTTQNISSDELQKHCIAHSRVSPREAVQHRRFLFFIYYANYVRGTVNRTFMPLSLVLKVRLYVAFFGPFLSAASLIFLALD